MDIGNQTDNQNAAPPSFRASSLIFNLTYIQRYFFLCVIFSLSLIPLIYFVASFYYEKSNSLEREISGNQYIKPIRQLLEQIEQHKILTYRFNNGAPELKNAILDIESQINESFKKLTSTENESDLHADSETNFQPKPSSSTDDLKKKWTVLSKQSFSINTKTSDRMHQQIIDDLQSEIKNIQDSYLLQTGFDLPVYYLVDVNLSKIPSIQIDLSDTLRQSLELFSDKSALSSIRDRLTYEMTAINNNLKTIKSNIETAFSYGAHTYDFSDYKNQTLTMFTEYNQNVEIFLTSVSSKLNAGEETNPTLQDVFSQGSAALVSGFSLWDDVMAITDHLLKQKKYALEKKFWISLSLSIFLALCAYLVGSILVYNTLKRLKEITEATNKFANGDLATRVPTLYRDEVGILGKTFNVMAKKTEELVKQLYQLLESTKAIAGGDLSIRIITDDPDSEFGKIAVAFNNMAESFENIIRRLQQIGINLTTSATEIAAAAKQQETITIEQEATTREISIAASEISSTAKEFANTMNDISVVAEQTSTLALSGKDALNNMESVMRQMVDASGNIAAKLAILNEKASNITSVITTITKVADQTNLLSLNASIEAEKAGEYGRSFSVIAREIRRLADQTAIATLDIEKMVNEIMTAVSSSVMGVDDFTQEIRVGVNQVKKVSEQLAEIIEQVQALTLRFETVNQGMQAQSTGAEQINEAIAQLSQTAQQTTESIQQFHKTIQELNIAAQELRSVAPRVNKMIKAALPNMPKEYFTNA